MIIAKIQEKFINYSKYTVYFNIIIIFCSTAAIKSYFYHVCINVNKLLLLHNTSVICVFHKTTLLIVFMN